MEGARLSEDPLLTSIKLSEALTDTGDDEKEEGRKGKVIFRSVIRDDNQLPERISLFGALALLNLKFLALKGQFNEICDFSKGEIANSNDMASLRKCPRVDRYPSKTKAQKMT